jgi:TrmH family RNA methyltransferase
MTQKPILIESPSNQLIKDLVRLKERKGAWADSSFLVEGLREAERAIDSGFEMEKIILCPNLGAKMPAKAAAVDLAKVSIQAFAKIAMREKSDGVLGVFKKRSWTFKDFDHQPQKPAFILALENIEKPGNLGAVLRTADCAGVDGVVVLGRSVDLWNPNVIRSSLGAVFKVPTVCTSNEEFYAWLTAKGVTPIGAAISTDAKSIFDIDFKESVAIVFGTEADGLSDFWRRSANVCGQIPMVGMCDSLNVSVSAAVFAFEVLRQRQYGWV